jgi:hypothetical protein
MYPIRAYPETHLKCHKDFKRNFLNMEGFMYNIGKYNDESSHRPDDGGSRDF